MKLSRREAEMMDLVLEAFDENNKLSYDELLLLFEDDEQQAAVIVSMLKQTGLVTASASYKPNGLPAFIIRTEYAITLIGGGGLARQFDEAVSQQQETPKPTKNAVTDSSGDYLQSLRARIMEQDETIKSLNRKNEQLQHIKGFLWLLGILCAALVIWIVKLLHK